MIYFGKTRALELTEDGGNYRSLCARFQILSNGTQAFTGGDRGRTLTLHCNLASIYWLPTFAQTLRGASLAYAEYRNAHLGP